MCVCVRILKGNPVATGAYRQHIGRVRALSVSSIHEYMYSDSGTDIFSSINIYACIITVRGKEHTARYIRIRL